MQSYFFHFTLIFFLFGVGVATILPLGLPDITWLFLIAFAILLLSWREDATLLSPLPFVSLLLVSFAFGLLRFEVCSWEFGSSPLAASVGTEVTLVGVVAKEPEPRLTQTNLYVEIGEDTVLVSTDSQKAPSYGDEISVTGKLKTPESFTTDLGRTFNYPAYLLARGVEYQISFAEVTVLSEGHGNKIVSWLLALKYRLMDSIESVLPEPQAGLGEGLLLGVKSALGEDLEAAFRTSGIIHIVVLSGQNVMLVVTFILFVLTLFLPKRPRLIVGLLAIIGFALLVGLSATVVRASIMASLLLIAQFLGRTYDLTRALLFAGVVMVFINPYILVYDIGFQFSFMATLGLILIAPKFESFLSEGLAKIGAKDFLLATIATQIAVLPLLLYHIGEVSLVAVAVNVLVLPIVPFAMFTTFATGVIGLVSFQLALPISFLAHLLLSYIIAVATFFSSLPLASFTVPPFAATWMIFLYIFIGLIVWWWSGRASQTKDNLQGWIIEEEESVQKAGASSAPAQETLPIFFR